VIGSLGEAVERCDRASMNLLKIDALRSAASPLSGDATAKEGHVNYDVFDVSVEACAAHTTGSGCHGWVLARAQRCEK
jgi:hypothetical protein